MPIPPCSVCFDSAWCIFYDHALICKTCFVKSGHTVLEYNAIKNEAIRKKNTDTRPLETAIDEKVRSFHRYWFKQASEAVAARIRLEDKYFKNDQEVQAFAANFIQKRNGWYLEYTPLFFEALVPIIKKKVARKRFLENETIDQQDKV